MKKYIMLFCLLVVTLSVGCAKKPAHVKRGEIGRESETSIKLQEYFDKYDDATGSIKAFAKLKIIKGDKVRQTDVVIIVEKPDKMRMDFMDALADVWANAGTNGKELWLYIPSKKRIYKGRAAKRNLRRLAKLNMRIDELIAVMTGAPPIGEHTRILQLGKRTESHFVALGGDLHMRISTKKGHLLDCTRYGDGGRRIDYEVSYDNFKSIGEVDFPYHVDIKFPERGSSLVIDYQNVISNVAIDQSLFKPTGFEKKNVMDLDYIPEEDL